MPQMEAEHHDPESGLRHVPHSPQQPTTATKREQEEEAELMPDEHKHYSHRAPWLRAGVLGANDGLVSVASLMLGVSSPPPYLLLFPASPALA